MIYVSKLQQDTLLLVDKMINENKTHSEIWEELYKNGYSFIVESRNGYISKTKTKLYKKNDEGKEEYSFVDLIKRRNGLACWETWRLS